MSVVGVASWNVFHGRALPAVHRDLLPEFAATLAAAEWEVCGLQELPPWWARPLAQACGASLRVAHTSLLRGALPRVQQCISASDPERLGARGAAVNALLVRPSAGWIVDHRVAVLRRVPQRRTMQAVLLARPGGRTAWVANVHTHNRPVAAAAADLGAALERFGPWTARSDGAILLGDLNLPQAQAAGLATTHGLTWLAGDRVDHILASPGAALAGSATAVRPRTTDGTAALSDHRLLTAAVRLPQA